MTIWGASVSLIWLLVLAIALLAFGFLAGRKEAKLRASCAFVRLMLEEAIEATCNPDLWVYEERQGPVRRCHVISGTTPLLDPWSRNCCILSVVRVDFYSEGERGPYGEFVLTFEDGRRMIHPGNRPLAMALDVRKYLVLHCGGGLAAVLSA